MCRATEHAPRMERRDSQPRLGSKIKGRGTCAPLRDCLHIGFGGTRQPERVSSAEPSPCLADDCCVLHTPKHPDARWPLTHANSRH